MKDTVVMFDKTVQSFLSLLPNTSLTVLIINLLLINYTKSGTRTEAELQQKSILFLTLR